MAVVDHTGYVQLGIVAETCIRFFGGEERHYLLDSPLGSVLHVESLIVVANQLCAVTENGVVAYLSVLCYGLLVYYFAGLDESRLSLVDYPDIHGVKSICALLLNAGAKGCHTTLLLFD